MIPCTGRPCWSHMAAECSDVGSNSSLLLSWFDLSTPGYGLCNKAWHGWENHVLVNRSVLRQETSRTACVSNHLGPLVHMISGFTNILFSTLGACYKVDNIGRLTSSVAPKLDCCPRRWLRDLCVGYHFAGFASCFAARSCLPKWFIITHVWFELGTHKKIPQTLGSSVGHSRSFCKDLAQSARGLKWWWGGAG